MKFHGRMHPGRLRDLGAPVEVRIHQPRKAADVTIKIWELDAFLGADGKPRREGTPDDLLATFTGAIEPAPGGRGARSPAWREFKVASVVIEDAPPDVMKFLLRFPGADTTYEIPVRSEDAEVEGTEYELGFSMEVGGSEKFRTKVPCLLSPATVRPRIRELLIVGFDEHGDPILADAVEVPPSGRAAAVGKPPDDFDEGSGDVAMLERQLGAVTKLIVDASGHLVRAVAEVGKAAEAIGLRAGKKLRVHVTDADAAPDGDLSAALAHPIALDGTVTVYRVDAAHRHTLLLGGTTVTPATRGPRPVARLSGALDGAPTVERKTFVKPGRGGR